MKKKIIIVTLIIIFLIVVYVVIAGIIANNMHKKQLTIDKMEFAYVNAKVNNLKAKYGPVEEGLMTCQLSEDKDKDILVAFTGSPRKMVFGIYGKDIDYIEDLRINLDGGCYVPEVKNTAETFVVFDQLQGLFPEFLQEKSGTDKLVSLLYKNYKKTTISIDDLKEVFSNVEYTQDQIFNRMIRADYENYKLVFINVKDKDHIKLTSRIGISDNKNDPAEMIYPE